MKWINPKEWFMIFYGNPIILLLVWFHSERRKKKTKTETETKTANPYIAKMYGKSPQNVITWPKYSVKIEIVLQWIHGKLPICDFDWVNDSIWFNN